MYHQAIEYCLQKVEHNMNTFEQFPESCNHDSAEWNPIEAWKDAGHWVNGFWVGLLWLAYAHTKEAKYEKAARKWTEKLSRLKDSVATHDLGFIFYLSNVLGARVTGDETLYADALHAAGTLVKRYNPRGEYLQAWGTPDGTRKDRGRINIDVMMNLELLFWASEYNGNSTYADIATQHARTTRVGLVRSDGSTAQVGDFNPDTGLFVHQETHQGFSFDSCWSRGQGWAQYGYATAYRYTGLPTFYWASKQITHYTLKNLPDDYVPYWDFNNPDIPDTYRDTSAAAVFACALMELGLCMDNAETERMKVEAEKIVQSLWENYSTRGTEMPALLREGARSVPHSRMDQALIYGDYYFFEALTRLATPEIANQAFPKPQPKIVS
jgi:unsaturated chondroitin disaccharide hydrolase